MSINQLEPSITKVFSQHISSLQEIGTFYLMVNTAFAFSDFTMEGTKTILKRAKELMPDIEKRKPDLFLPGGATFEGHAKDLQKYVEREAKREHPFLNAQMAVALWGWLEALVEDVLVALITSRPEVHSQNQLENIRIELSRFQLMDKEDRARYLLKELEAKNKKPASSRNGINAFDPLLEPFELTLPVKDETRESLFELNHVRNVIVHRSHIVDSRFSLACPRLGYKRGDRLKVKPDQIKSYCSALNDFGLALMKRISDRWPKKEAARADKPGKGGK